MMKTSDFTNRYSAAPFIDQACIILHRIFCGVFFQYVYGLEDKTKFVSLVGSRKENFQVPLVHVQFLRQSPRKNRGSDDAFIKDEVRSRKCLNFFAQSNLSMFRSSARCLVQ